MSGHELGALTLQPWQVVEASRMDEMYDRVDAEAVLGEEISALSLQARDEEHVSGLQNVKNQVLIQLW